MLERAGRALGRPAEAVAQALAHAHHGAALADPAQARRVRGHDDARSRRFRGAQLVEPEPRDEGVRVDHVGTLGGEPPVEALGPPDRGLALALLARGRRGYGIPVDGDTVVLVAALGGGAGIRRSHEHLLP
ncbi:MAG: hypothetical protein AUI36_23425 [Cyanobacteria bacterium 13_1_40CM_2_61_4]|nr:MAG: hypothetical protein AUI36_23425 [Cyanobacteria bacterium 13_1_40CM_2_61_4]